MNTNYGAHAALHLIPGAYDRTTLTHRQPGSMGGGAFGSGALPIGSSLLDAATIAERELEGGGGAAERRLTIELRPPRGPALANDNHSESQTPGGRWWSRLWRLAGR